MIDISVIVPVYKVEKFIGRCVASVARQKGVTTELILVDDRGGDQSVAVAVETLTKANYVNVTILGHEKNRGLSAARNTGTDIASGKYVFYLDSDDWLASDDALLKLKDVAEKENVACVVGEYADCEAEGGKELQVPYKFATTSAVHGEDKVRSIYASKCIPVTAWNKLILRDFLQDNHLSFHEGILHEDSLWTFQLMALLPSICMVNTVTYCYAINPESIMNKMSAEKFSRRKDSSEIVLNEMYNFLQEHNIKSTALTNYIEETRNYMYLKLLVDGLEWSDMKAFFKKTFRKLPFSKWCSMPTKLKLLHIYQLLPYPLCFWTYKMMASIQRKR